MGQTKRPLVSKLMSLKKTFITLDEIEDLISYNDYEELRAIIDGQIEGQVLKPVGKKNTNGMIPPLHLKYRICNVGEDMTPYLEEIRHLHPDLKISAYMAHPKLYKNHRDILLPLSEMLKDRPESLLERMSKNERAYSIWHDEKTLDHATTKAVIRFLKLEDRLNYYLTPEPFFDYVLRNREDMTVLIIENKDTWFTFRKLFTKNPDKCFLHGKTIDAIIYGEGNKVTKPKRMEQYEDDVLGRKARFLYFGDLDFTGIEMFQRVCMVNPCTKIKLFTELYGEMLRLTEIEKLGQIRTKQRNSLSIEEFLAIFTIDQARIIRKILNEYKYIPQEVLSYPILAGMLKKEVLPKGMPQIMGK